MQLLECSLQHCRLLLTLGITGRATHQHTDPAHPLARLCSRHKRPCRSASQPDELAPSHCWPPRSEDSSSYQLKLALWKGPSRERTMSALGHKRTYALQQGMSALHPIATAKGKFGKPPCLLYPQKQT